MSEELMSLAGELNRLQTGAARAALLAALDKSALVALQEHYATYDDRLHPDGRINCTLIGAALLDREQSLAVIADFRQEATHVAA